MAKKDTKAKKADKKARVAQKQEKKATQKEKKTAKKGPKNADDSDAEDVDLDAVLAEYARQQEQFLKVTETVCEPPSPPRSSATILASPSNTNELFIFGGELFNGATARFFNDLFVYNISRDEWKKVTSPNSPLPRSGHAWCRGGNAGGIYLFGGEFSSPKQGTFYHYNDFWKLDTSTREWSRIETKGKGPPARSGHRMTYFKNYVILFGGFQDTSQTTKYLSDLWVYDCANYTWHEPKMPPASGKPDARSSFSFLPHESGTVLYSGYSRAKTTGGGNSQQGGKQGKGGGSGSGSSKSALKPVIHQDTWFLRITPPAADAPSATLPVLRWERRKRPVNSPNPPRTGGTMCAHKGRGIQFGGVHDVEESEEGIDSEFFNQLYAWNIDRNRFFPLALRRPRQNANKKSQEQRGRRERGKQAEEELLRNLRALEMKGSISTEGEDGDGDDTDSLGTTPVGDEEDDEPERPEKPVQFEMPHPRFNAQLTVQDDVLYIFGGTFEKGDREFTFDEMYAIDLGKLDGVKEIYRREPEDWVGSEDEDEDSEDDDEEDDEEEDEGTDVGEDEEPKDLGDDLVKSANPVDNEPPSTPTKPSQQTPDSDAEEETPSKPAEGPSLPHPRPFESLRDFYARTTIEWQDLILQAKLAESSGGEPARLSPKEIKKVAFERAEREWWDCREEIMQLEDEQSEAGIGDVVSLEGKGGAEAGAKRRR